MSPATPFRNRFFVKVWYSESRPAERAIAVGVFLEKMDFSKVRSYLLIEGRL